MNKRNVTATYFHDGPMWMDLIDRNISNGGFIEVYEPTKPANRHTKYEIVMADDRYDTMAYLGVLTESNHTDNLPSFVRPFDACGSWHWLTLRPLEYYLSQSSTQFNKREIIVDLLEKTKENEAIYRLKHGL